MSDNPSAGSLTFRSYQSGDEAAILALFSESFGKEMSEAYWRWRYLDNPAAEVAIELAWDGSRLAGHYAVSPTRLTIDGTPMLAALSMTTMTGPDYRGQGLFPMMAERLYDRLGEAGFDLVFGFPNHQSHRIFARDLSWQDLAPVPMMSVALDAVREVPGKGEVVEEPAFGSWLDEIEPSSDGITLVRDPGYMTWRFGAELEHTYRYFVVRDGTRATGCAVVKVFGTDLDIVDLYCERDALPAVIGFLAGVGRDAGTDRLNTWMSVYDPLFSSLERMGFQAGSPVTYMGGRPLAGADSEVFDPRRWRVSMAMSDVF